MKHIPLILTAAVALCASAQNPSDLPHVQIVTEGNAPIESTEVYIPSTITVTDASGTPTVYETAKVRGRGNTLFTLAKKPYKVKLASKANFAGTEYAKAKKWNLMADHGDKSLLRNAVASFIAKEAGQPFAPIAKYVDLTVNGQYQGTYRLTDQIDIRKKRVDITAQPDVVTSTTDITGGYLLEIDDSADDLEGSVFTTSRGIKVTIKNPDEDYIVPAQIDYISQFVQKAEDALFAGNTDYIDLPSFIQWYITAELTAEPNSFRSVYFYKKAQDEKLYFGPVWDFDFAFDNSARWGSRPEALVAQEGRGPEWCFAWIDRLRSMPAFHAAVNDAWKTLAANGIVDKTNQFIDTQAAAIDKSQRLNFGLYPIDQKAHDEQHLFSSYSENVNFLKATLAARADFLSTAFQTLADGGKVPVTTESAIEEIADEPLHYVTLRGNTLVFSSTEPVEGSLAVYNTAGQQVFAAPIAPEVTLPALPRATYILQWLGHSVKFVL